VTMHKSLTAGMPEDLESLLAEAYAADIPADLAAALERRAAAVTLWHPQSAARWRTARPRSWRLVQPRLRSLVRTRRRLVIIPILVAAILGTTAVAGSGFLSFSYPSEGGFTWQQGEQLGLTKTVDGFQLTLERAYADANRMMVAVTVSDQQNRGWSQVEVFPGVSVTDSSGAKWELDTGVGGPQGAATAANILWFNATSGPAAAGRRPFVVTITSVSVRDPATAPPFYDPRWRPWHEVPVNASFSFDLTVAGGFEATPHPSSESNDGVTFTLEGIVTSPSMVTINLRMAGLPSDTDCGPIDVSVSRGGQDLPVSDVGKTGSEITVHTSVGVDAPTGDWTVTVIKLVGLGTGPWTLHFSIP
jgi:hypothetical protein